MKDLGPKVATEFREESIPSSERAVTGIIAEPSLAEGSWVRGVPCNLAGILLEMDVVNLGGSLEPLGPRVGILLGGR